MVPSPWDPEARADWTCKFCTFRRTGLLVFNYDSNEKRFRCKLHRGVCFKQGVAADVPSRSTTRKPHGGEPLSAATAKLEKRSQSLEAESQRLRAPQDGGPAANESSESDELREDTDGLVKYVQRLESIKLPWMAQPLQVARGQLGASRRKLYDNTP
eukprot:5934232-Pyramimonas_sp.AAC.1